MAHAGNEPTSKAESHAGTHGAGRYFVIWAILLAFTGITVWTGYMDLGALNLPLAMTIASIKATLVILFFMHVKYSSRLTKMVVGMSFFFLAILFGLTLTDYMSRGWYASPRGTTGAGTQVGISVNTPERAPSAPVQAEPAAK